MCQAALLVSRQVHHRARADRCSKRLKVTRKKKVGKLDRFLLDTEKPKDGFFFVSAVAAGVNADCRQFASFTPSFDGERRNTENFSNFTDSEEIRKRIYREFLISHKSGTITILININVVTNLYIK